VRSEKYHHFERDCFIAVLIPIISLCFLPISVEGWHSIGLVGVAFCSTIIACWHLYKMIGQVDDLTWLQQLENVVQNVHLPVFVVDNEYRIVFLNSVSKSYQIDTGFLSQKTLIDFLIENTEHHGNQEQNGMAQQYSDMLNEMHHCISIPLKDLHCHVSELITPSNRRWGMMVELKNITFAPVICEEPIEEVEEENKEHFDIASAAITQSQHPMVILDPQSNIQEISISMMRLLVKDESIVEQLIGKWQQISFLSILQTFIPQIVPRFKKALDNQLDTQFIGEYEENFCDWIVTPVWNQQQLSGYRIEMIYPSKQECLGYQESLERLHLRQLSMEKDLARFTRNIGKLNLYQKDAYFAVREFNPENYRHPLLKNSAKIITQVGGGLQKLHQEVEHLKHITQSKVTEDPGVTSDPMQQVNVLSSTVTRNVKEIQYDFSSIYDELMKLKNVMKEQKSLSQAFINPINQGIASGEQALLKTIEYSQTITLVLHDLHYSQSLLAQSSAMSVKQIESVKQSIIENKEKLQTLLIEFEKLKFQWRAASDNLKSCMRASISSQQAADRWGKISENTQKYGQELNQRIRHLVDLTEKIEFKSSGIVEKPKIPMKQSSKLQDNYTQFTEVVIDTFNRVIAKGADVK